MQDETIVPGTEPRAQEAEPVRVDADAGTGREPAGGIDDLESAKAALAQARREAAARRREAQELAARLKAIEDAQLSETERLRREAEELRARAQEAERRMLDARILVAASRLGFADPEDALALADRSAIGEDGAGIEDALKAVLKAKPYLRAQAREAAPQAVGNPQGGAGSRLDQAKAERARQLFPFLSTNRS